MPPEIRARGPRAELAFQRAMRNGRVQVFRGRIMLLGQDRAGKTSLKKSLLGITFDPEEESTVGIKVDPSKFQVDVDQVQNWQATEQKKLDVSEFADDIARIMVKDLTETEIDQRNIDDLRVVLEQVIFGVIFQIWFFYFHRWKQGGRGDSCREFYPTVKVLKSRQQVMALWRGNYVTISVQSSSWIFRSFLTSSETLVN